MPDLELKALEKFKFFHVKYWPKEVPQLQRPAPDGEIQAHSAIQLHTKLD